MTGVSVLVVDDDPDSRDMLGQIVASFGAEVRTAAHGAEAQQLLSQQPADLVLCDLLMPHMSGFRLMDWLQSVPELASVPVIAVSALGTEVDTLRTWSAGFSGHLVKPVDYAQIEAQLRRVFGRAATT